MRSICRGNPKRLPRQGGAEPPCRYLHQPVLGPQPGSGGRRVGVDRADELPRPGLLAVQVEAVAGGAFLQVTETWAQLLLSV